MDNVNLNALLRKLPKVDLHCHLDGSVRVSTLLELAREQGVTLRADNEADLFRLVYAGPTCASLVEYLRGFDITLSVLQTEAALRRVAFELVEDCAADGVRYVEVRYAPLLHQQRGLSLEKIVEAVWSGLQAGTKQTGVDARMILCALRTSSSDASLETAKLCVALRQSGVVAFDLAGAEAGYPPSLHAQAFDWIHQHQLGCTIHAGEAAGADSIAQALHPAGAQRLGHGTRLQEDAGLLVYVRDRRIPLEVCLSSNAQTKAVTSLGQHPALQYHRAGVVVTLNTDNRLITHTTMTQELAVCKDVLGASMEELRAMVLAGVQAAFLPWPQRQILASEIDEAWSRGLSS